MTKVLDNFAEFDDLVKLFNKASTVINKEGGTTPRFYLRFVAELEDFVNAVC